MSLTWHRLGRVEYQDGLELQRQFSEARKAGTTGDNLLLLEHPPVLTLGRGAGPENVLFSKELLAARGVTIHDTDRGGDVTYHGPGQIVGYPLLHLPPGKQDVRKYVRSLEEVVIRTLADEGITAARIEKWPGVWVEKSRLGGPRKICALGVHLSRWYTRHGFALNVRPDLSHFELIVPCGIREAGVTTMEAELNRPVDLRQVEDRLVKHFGEVLETDVQEAPPRTQTVSVVIARREPSQEVLLLQRTLERGGFWQHVTGRVEQGESPERAAARELREETGLQLPVTALGYRHSFAWGEGSPPRVAEEMAFVAYAGPELSLTLSHEHQRFEWVPLAGALERVPYEGLRQAARLAFAGR